MKTCLCERTMHSSQLIGDLPLSPGLWRHVQGVYTSNEISEQGWIMWCSIWVLAKWYPHSGTPLPVLRPCCVIRNSWILKRILGGTFEENSVLKYGFIGGGGTLCCHIEHGKGWIAINQVPFVYVYTAHYWNPLSRMCVFSFCTNLDLEWGLSSCYSKAFLLVTSLLFQLICKTWYH